MATIRLVFSDQTPITRGLAPDTERDHAAVRRDPADWLTPRREDDADQLGGVVRGSADGEKHVHRLCWLGRAGEVVRTGR
jgi:hypothetical protein